MSSLEHYYSEKPSAKSAPQRIHVNINGYDMVFTTDVGVFSKHAVDFGTKLLLESFHFPIIKGPILDVGCGYGPIGLSLAKQAPDRAIIMIDVNERAIELAKKNRQANGVNNVSVMKSDLFENIRDKHFAAILSNPPIRAGKKVVYELFRQAYEHLEPRGEFWIVIQKKQGAPSAKKELISLFGDVDVVNKSKGYFIFRAKKHR